MSKRYLSKIIQIGDILQWHEKQEIELSPKYQRNSVWNDKAKSYLIDTIVRGLPIPPVFLRQKTEVLTKKTFREIIDGQQRLRAILEYIVEEKYSIMKSHNKEYGGKKYSELPEEIQEDILEYEILAEVVVEKDESIIYDMFARLNSNNMVLNRQELRNSKYWGEFKVFAYQMASQFKEFFIENKLFSDRQMARMDDVEFISSLIIVLLDGIITETPSYVDKVYDKNDKSFDAQELIEEKLNKIMKIIITLYDYLNGNFGCFTSKVYFYTLFCTIVHQMYGLSNIISRRNPDFSDSNIGQNVTDIQDCVIQFSNDYDRSIKDKDNSFGLYNEFSAFEKNHRTRTTSKNERKERVEFLSKYFVGTEYGE